MQHVGSGLLLEREAAVGRQVVGGLDAVGLLDRRQPGQRLPVEDDALDPVAGGYDGLAHSSAGFIRPSFSINPSVAPLMGRSSAMDITTVVGSHIAACTQKGGS